MACPARREVILQLALALEPGSGSDSDFGHGPGPDPGDGPGLILPLYGSPFLDLSQYTFCTRFWPMIKTVVRGLQISGSISCHFAIKIRRPAKLFDDSLLQLVVGAAFIILQNRATLNKMNRHSQKKSPWA